MNVYTELQFSINIHKVFTINYYNLLIDNINTKYIQI